MNSLEDKIIETEVVVINLEGYRFRITDQCVTRTGRRGDETSAGLLVSDHFEAVYAVLYLAHLLKDCEVKEAMAQWYIEDQEKYDAAPELTKVLDALVRKISALTDGVYDDYYEDCRIRHDQSDEEAPEIGELPYLTQMQDIFWYILDLREGKYHGSESPRYKGRRGIPRIETTGERLYGALLDLIWRMDNGMEKTPEEIETLRRWHEQAARVIPDARRR